MEKSKVLAIGLGGCGNAQLSEFLDRDKRYTGVFMNTNLAEMESLKHFDKERRCFYIPNADGCGADRDLAETYIKDEAPKFAEMIKKFTNQDVILMFASIDGGTGSKAITLLPRVIKKLCPDKSINLVATVPALNQTIISFDNAIATWNEIIDLQQKHIIDSIQYIDNNKLDNEKEINRRAMAELDLGISVSENNTDTKDSRRGHTALGYKVILNLNNKTSNINTAIDASLRESMFFAPENLECNVLIGSISKLFNAKELEDRFVGYDFRKINAASEDMNTIILGGCKIPTEPIQLIQEARQELEKRRNSRVVNNLNDLKVRVRTDYSNNNTQYQQPDATTAARSSKLSSADLDDMFNDDSFWN